MDENVLISMDETAVLLHICPAVSVSGKIVLRLPREYGILCSEVKQVPVLLIAHSIYCDVMRTRPIGGSTYIKQMLPMKSWLADLFTGAKPKEKTAIPIVLIILTA
ncbi:MAG: hypothetical protein ACI4F1_15005 [Bariatricus sp.]